MSKSQNTLEKPETLKASPVKTTYFSTWLDNTKVKFLLGWRPEVSLHELIDRSWNYTRNEDDDRKIWYPRLNDEKRTSDIRSNYNITHKRLFF